MVTIIILSNLSAINPLQIFVDDNLIEGAEYLITVTFDGTMKPPSDQDGLYWSSYTSLLDGATQYCIFISLPGRAAISRILTDILKAHTFRHLFAFQLRG